VDPLPRLHEPAVSLTDAALAVEAAAFALRLRREPADTPKARALKRAFVGFFAATSVASTCGAILHGLVPDKESTSNRVLWRISMIAIGGAALSGWSLGARLLLPAPAATRVERLAATEFAAYTLLAGGTSIPYKVAIANYLPAAAFLGVALGAEARRPGAGPGARQGLAALCLTFAAAVVQARGIAIHPRWFDHNALYHVIQGVAIAVLFASARNLLESRAPQPSQLS
jgi:hypothetical protein